jgi:Holliday junction DNA helicase RuvB
MLCYEEFVILQIKGNGTIDIAIAKYALKALNVDAHGLDEMDNKILNTIIDKFKGGPVGLSTLATAVSKVVKQSRKYTILLTKRVSSRHAEEKLQIRQAFRKIKTNIQGGLF